jgi:ubiquinone/menaquinone biosynthesis C-methylase UbiE
MSAAGYVLDSAWHAERDRLDSLTSLYDARTMRLADRLGLGEGWRCLDVGAGTGSLARLLAERVGREGTVVALDVDTRFLEPIASESLEVLRADVVAGPLPEGRYDLVHARLVLEHLPQRDAVLRSMAAALRPGGWLLIEDFDWATAGLVDPPSETHARVVEACRALFSAAAYDPSYGRTLPRRLDALGLERVGTHAEAIQVRADIDDGIPQWDLLVDQLAPGLVAAGLLDAAQLASFHALTHDGETVCFAPLMVSCWGRRPLPLSRAYGIGANAAGSQRDDARRSGSMTTGGTA